MQYEEHEVMIKNIRTLRGFVIFVVRISFINAVNCSSYGCRRIRDIKDRSSDGRNTR
jgi:hypothetical protein